MLYFVRWEQRDWWGSRRPVLVIPGGRRQPYRPESIVPTVATHHRFPVVDTDLSSIIHCAFNTCALSDALSLSGESGSGSVSGSHCCNLCCHSPATTYFETYQERAKSRPARPTTRSTTIIAHESIQHTRPTRWRVHQHASLPAATRPHLFLRLTYLERLFNRSSIAAASIWQGRRECYKMPRPTKTPLHWLQKMLAAQTCLPSAPGTSKRNISAGEKL